MSPLGRWILFTALLGVIGSSSFRWLVLPRCIRSVPEWPEIDGCRRGAASFGRGSGLAVIIGLFVVFAGQLQDYHDPLFSTLAVDFHVLLGLVWGRTWMAALALSVLLVVALSRAERGETTAAGWWMVALPLTLALAVYPSLSGHAIASERARAFAVLFDVLHVGAAGAWVGGLALMVGLEARHRRRGMGSLLPTLVPAFSSVAVVSVATLLATGLFASWLHVPRVGALFTSGYGQLLLAKVAFAIGALWLGFQNWRRHTPRMPDADATEALRRSAVMELTVMQVVLVLTAILVGTGPPV